MMKRTDKKENLGITLIALVITIVILIILAGITIGGLIHYGIFDKAKRAKSDYTNSQEDENSKISEYDKEMADVAGTPTSIDAADVEFKPDTSDTSITYDEDWKKVTNVKEALDYLYTH